MCQEKADYPTWSTMPNCVPPAFYQKTILSGYSKTMLCESIALLRIILIKLCNIIARNNKLKTQKIVKKSTITVNMKFISYIIKDYSFIKTAIKQEYTVMPVRLMNVICLEYTEYVQA